MGRGKIEIKKIENVNSRQVTFSKRRAGLLKKANELAVLCDADVAVIIFSSTRKLFEYSSSCMKRILSRYNKGLDSTQVPPVEYKPENQEQKELDVLQEEIATLKSKQMRLLGKDLVGLGLQELRTLEQQLNEGLLCIKEKKEQILMQQIAESRMQEQRVMLENESLRRQVEELRGVFPSTSHPSPLRIAYRITGRSDHAVKEGSGTPETACNGVLEDEDEDEDEDSDTTLHLGPPCRGSKKRKTSDGETQSSNSETQLGLTDPFRVKSSPPMQ